MAEIFDQSLGVLNICQCLLDLLLQICNALEGRVLLVSQFKNLHRDKPAETYFGFAVGGGLSALVLFLFFLLGQLGLHLEQFNFKLSDLLL